MDKNESKSEEVTANLSTRDARDRCPSCNILWHQHPGIQATCGELMEARKAAEVIQTHYDMLLKGLDSDAKRHPWYGPCDAFNDGGCAECERLFRGMEASMNEYKAHCAESAAELEMQDNEIVLLKSRLSLALAALRQAKECTNRYGLCQTCRDEIDKAIAEIEAK